MAATDRFITTCVCATLVTAGVRAEVTADVDARGSVYQDTDRTTVTTAAVAGALSPVAEVAVRGSYMADIVSSASIDVVSAATDHFDEVRHEAGVTPSYADGTNTLSTGYRYSVENDWESHSLFLDGARDFFEHDLTVGLGLSAIHNAVGRQDDRTFSEELWVLGAGANVVVVAGRDDLWSLAYAGSLLLGYQASPYRAVRFRTPVGVIATTPESVPDERWRHALAALWNHHAFEDTAIRSHARLYVDSWGLVSATLGSEYAVGFGPFEPAVFARLYAQSGTSFYQDIYDERRRYMTSDRELSRLGDAFGGARLTYRHGAAGFLDELRAEVKATGFAFLMPDFSRLPRRQGVIAELALGGTF